jgi:hypothetical protein
VAKKISKTRAMLSQHGLGVVFVIIKNHDSERGPGDSGLNNVEQAPYVLILERRPRCVAPPRRQVCVGDRYLVASAMARSGMAQGRRYLLVVGRRLQGGGA